MGVMSVAPPPPQPQQLWPTSSPGMVIPYTSMAPHPTVMESPLPPQGYCECMVSCCSNISCTCNMFAPSVAVFDVMCSLVSECLLDYMSEVCEMYVTCTRVCSVLQHLATFPKCLPPFLPLSLPPAHRSPFPPSPSFQVSCTMQPTHTLHEYGVV